MLFGRLLSRGCARLIPRPVTTCRKHIFKGCPSKTCNTSFAATKASGKQALCGLLAFGRALSERILAVRQEPRPWRVFTLIGKPAYRPKPVRNQQKFFSVCKISMKMIGRANFSGKKKGLSWLGLKRRRRCCTIVSHYAPPDDPQQRIFGTVEAKNCVEIAITVSSGCAQMGRRPA